MFAIYVEYSEICGLYLESNGVYRFLFENTYSWTSRFLSLFWFCWRLQEEEELKCAKDDATHKGQNIVIYRFKNRLYLIRIS